MKCPWCGKKVQANWPVCPSCKERLHDDELESPKSVTKNAGYQGQDVIVNRGSTGHIVEIHNMNIGDVSKKEFKDMFSETINDALKDLGIPSILQKEKKIELNKQTNKQVNAIETKVREALSKFKEPIGNAEMYLRLGNRAYQNGLYAVAVEYYDNALEIDENNYDGWYNKGVLYNEMGEYGGAVRCLKKSLEIDSNNVYALKSCALAYDCMGEYEKAITYYDKALALQPNNADIWNNRGISLDKNECINAAIDCYDKAINMQPYHAAAWNNKGISLADQGNYSEALECFEKALSYKEDFTEAYNNLAVVLERLNKYEEAIDRYQQALAINPSLELIQKNKQIAQNKVGS